MASVLFLLSLLLQGYYWLGQRADTRLPLPRHLVSGDKRQDERAGRSTSAGGPVPATKSWLIPPNAAFQQLDKSSSTNDPESERRQWRPLAPFFIQAPAPADP